jgi:hypothetical protein
MLGLLLLCTCPVVLAVINSIPSSCQARYNDQFNASIPYTYASHQNPSTTRSTMSTRDHQFDQPPWWTSSIHGYLADNNITCTSAKPMQGGHSTYIWKLENFSVANAQQHVSCNQCILKYPERWNQTLSDKRALWSHPSACLMRYTQQTELSL